MGGLNLKKFRPIAWFGRWSGRQRKEFQRWLENKWIDGKKEDSNFKMDSQKLTEQYPPFSSKIRSHVPGLDETAKREYFAKHKTIPFLRKLGFDGVKGVRYWKQESYEDLELLIRDHKKRIEGDINNLEKKIEDQTKLQTITIEENAKLLLQIKAPPKKEGKK